MSKSKDEVLKWANSREQASFFVAYCGCGLSFKDPYSKVCVRCEEDAKVEAGGRGKDSERR